MKPFRATVTSDTKERTVTLVFGIGEAGDPEAFKVEVEQHKARIAALDTLDGPPNEKGLVPWQWAWSATSVEGIVTMKRACWMATPAFVREQRRISELAASNKLKVGKSRFVPFKEMIDGGPWPSGNTRAA